MMRAEVIATALRATPPALTGVMVENRYRRLVGWEGDGQSRVFRLEGELLMTMRDLQSRTQDVVQDGQVRYVRLHIRFSGQRIRCPACRMECGSGGPFWGHYNAHHANRPFWLNRDDWTKMLAGEWVPPPEV